MSCMVSKTNLQTIAHSKKSGINTKGFKYICVHRHTIFFKINFFSICVDTKYQEK